MFAQARLVTPFQPLRQVQKSAKVLAKTGEKKPQREGESGIGGEPRDDL